MTLVLRLLIDGGFSFDLYIACAEFFRVSWVNRWWSPSEVQTKRNNKTRSCTWAKRIYTWRLLSSCRAPLTRARVKGLTPAICKFAVLMYMSEFFCYVMLNFWRRSPAIDPWNPEDLNTRLAESKLKPPFIMSRSTNVISTCWIRETAWELLRRTGHLQPAPGWLIMCVSRRSIRRSDCVCVVGSRGPNLKPETVGVYVINGSRNGLNTT